MYGQTQPFDERLGSLANKDETRAPMKSLPLLVLLMTLLTACQSPKKASDSEQKTKEPPKVKAKARPSRPSVMNSTPKSPPPKYQRVISVDVVDTLLSEVMAEIREKTGAEIYVDPRVDRKITITLRDLPWRDIVRVIARIYKLDLKVKERDKFVFHSRPKTSIEFADANLKTALLMLAKKSGQNIIIAPEVKGKVSARLEQISASDALRALAKNGGYEVVSTNKKGSAIQGSER